MTPEERALEITQNISNGRHYVAQQIREAIREALESFADDLELANKGRGGVVIQPVRDFVNMLRVRAKVMPK